MSTPPQQQNQNQQMTSAQQHAQLRAARAQLAASIPDETAFEEMIEAQVMVLRANRDAMIDRLSALNNL
jgi:hypothetical protein